MARQHLRCVQPRAPTDSVEQVRSQRQLDHLFDEDTAHHLRSFAVPRRVERIERTEVRRQRGVFQLDRPLEVLAKILKSLDPRRRQGYDCPLRF
jgi:hypothetical protein